MVDAVAVASEVLDAVPAYLWDGASLPVPVEDIVDSQFGLRVEETDDLARIAGAPAGETLSGLLVVDDKQIWVSAGEAAASPGRRRFTVGHELGHWCLHREEHRKVFCRAPDIAADADIEEEASAFAGALLFPEPLLRTAHAQLDGDLVAIGERFGASGAATTRAVFRAVHGPAILERSRALECFFYDDPSYEAWRSLHRDEGFVVNDSIGNPDGVRLHRLSCSYLDRAVSAGRPRTQQPKWASLDLDELRRTFPHAVACGRCHPITT